MVDMFGEKTLTQASELRKQREAALRGEDYTPDTLDMANFPSATMKKPAPVVKVLCCPKCARTFNLPINLANHEKWAHDQSVQEKEFHRPPPPPPPPLKFDTKLVAMSPTTVVVSLFIGGNALEDIRAEREREREAREERQKQRDKEAKRRRELREAETAVNAEERRCGSRRRGSYTARFKLKVLEIFDAVNDDPFCSQKVKTFESRSHGVPYGSKHQL